jgi:hypothetical protein
VVPAACAAATGCPGDTTVILTPAAIGSSNIQLKLRDQDGEEATIQVQLTGTTSLSAVNVTDVFTTANTSLAVDLRAKNNKLANVTFELLAQTCPDSVARAACLVNSANTNAAVNRASVVASANGFTYTPPANFSTHAQNGSAQFDAAAGRFQEVVWYRMRRAGNPSDFADGWVQIPVRAKTTFAATRMVFQSAPCTECHVPDGGGPLYATFAYDTWRNGDLLNLPHRRVDLTDPENSGFICYPRRDTSRGCTTNHNIDAKTYPGASARINSLLEWIRSGANNF